MSNQFKPKSWTFKPNAFPGQILTLRDGRKIKVKESNGNWIYARLPDGSMDMWFNSGRFLGSRVNHDQDIVWK